MVAVTASMSAAAPRALTTESVLEPFAGQSPLQERPGVSPFCAKEGDTPFVLLNYSLTIDAVRSTFIVYDVENEKAEIPIFWLRASGWIVAELPCRRPVF